MDKQKSKKFPGIILITVSVVCILFWLVMLFFAFFLGGAAGPPDFQRGVPMNYVYIIGLGIIGACMSFAAGIKASKGKVPSRSLLLTSAILGAAGSIPLFLMELYAVGFTLLLVGILPPAIGIILMR